LLTGSVMKGKKLLKGRGGGGKGDRGAKGGKVSPEINAVRGGGGEKGGGGKKG